MDSLLKTALKKGQRCYQEYGDPMGMPEGVTWTRPRGGNHMWVELPDGYSSISLMLWAVEKGVAIIFKDGSTLGYFE